ncbi:MAG: peptidylprolyl isomerase [Candidatus Pacearchaeota archaeon]
MLIKKGDFIELEFTGKCEGEIFDTTNNEIAKKIFNKEVKPIKIIVGEKMVVDGLDKAIEGKEINKIYKIKLKPKEAFGDRRKELIKTVPLNAFKDKNLVKEGNLLLIDGILVKILKVASGRVLIDMNHPLAGKEIEYEFKILRKIESDDEKIKTIAEFFGIKDYEIEKNNEKIEIKLKKMNKNFEELLKKYIKNIEITKIE